ncbi:piggyBac transposable element-derived protein 4-like [Athalia rosae]|uniref:piggyBac transposable element-derived protein 4-like n=1 Tax=Athalia rosae TaxID=37344 RepID=UPI0020337835|nr:piggyBac transposable element-derived protein 4-like [Athalia rosae]
MHEIVTNTNNYLDKLRPNYEQKSSVCPTIVEELHAFFGLLYLLGLYKASHLNLHEYWNTDGSAPDCFRAAMSLNRFRALMTAFRFDDHGDREERKKLVNLAPIREFSSGCMKRCQENYSVGPYTTIDEMLEAFRRRCKFRQYIPNKPARYGIKIYSKTRDL